MPDIDKVLEAEEAIRNIAKDLEKMKSAAELMDSAQTKIDTVIDTSKEIITKTGEFIKEGTQIVERIGDYDIQGDLSKIIESTINVENNTKILSNSLTDLEAKLENIKNDLETFLEEKIKEIKNSLDIIKDENRQTGKITTGLIVVNIIIGIVLLLEIFQVF